MRYKALIIKMLTCCLVLSCLSACRQNDGQSVKKRKLNFATVGVVKSLDPALAADVTSRNMAGAIFDTLLQYDYMARPYKLEPSILAEMPTISADNRLYTFKIRKDLYFHNDECFSSLSDRQLTVDDIIFSFKRVCDPDMHSPVLWIFQGRIKGIEQFREQVRTNRANGVLAGYPSQIDGLKKIDDYTFSIELSDPDPRFLYYLAMPGAAVVSKKATIYYKNDVNSHPIGSGAFKLKSWEKNYRLILERHPDYRTEFFAEATEPNDRKCKLPLSDEIVYNIVKSPFTAWLLFLQGELDMTALDKDNLDVLSENGQLSPALTARGIKFVQAPAFEIRYVGFNMQNEKFRNNPYLRKAISCAYDLSRREKHAGGQLLRAAGPVIIGVDGYDPDLVNPYAYNLEKAKEYLKLAGYEDGIDPATNRPLELNFDLNGSSSHYLQLGELLASDLAKIGIKVNVCLNSSPRFFAKIRQGETDLFFLSWVGDYPDAENFLQLFYSKRIGSANRVGYSNQAFDDMFEAIIHMQQSEERTQLYRKMAEYIVNECVWIYDGIPMNYQLTHSFLENYYPHNFNFGTLKYLSVDPKKREELKKSFKPLDFRGL